MPPNVLAADENGRKSGNIDLDLEIKKIREAIQNEVIKASVAEKKREPRYNLERRASLIRKDKNDLRKKWSRKAIRGIDPLVLEIAKSYMWYFNREYGMEIILSAGIHNGYLTVKDFTEDVVNTITIRSKEIVNEGRLPTELRTKVGSLERNFYHIWSTDQNMAEYASLAHVLDVSNYFSLYFIYGVIDEKMLAETLRVECLPIMRKFETSLLKKLAMQKMDLQIASLMKEEG